LKRAQEFDIAKILPMYENYYQKVIQKIEAKMAKA